MYLRSKWKCTSKGNSSTGRESFFTPPDARWQIQPTLNTFGCLSRTRDNTELFAPIITLQLSLAKPTMHSSSSQSPIITLQLSLAKPSQFFQSISNHHVAVIACNAYYTQFFQSISNHHVAVIACNAYYTQFFQSISNHHVAVIACNAYYTQFFQSISNHHVAVIACNAFAVLPVNLQSSRCSYRLQRLLSSSSQSPIITLQLSLATPSQFFQSISNHHVADIACKAFAVLPVNLQSSRCSYRLQSLRSSSSQSPIITLQLSLAKPSQFFQSISNHHVAVIACKAYSTQFFRSISKLLQQAKQL